MELNLRMKTSPQMKRPREFEENDGSPPAKRPKTKRFVIFNAITSFKSFSSKEPPNSIQHRIPQSKTMCITPTKPKFQRHRKSKPIPEDPESMNLELLEAAANGRSIRAKCLIKNGANVNFILKSKSSLHWASYNGHIEVVKFLLEDGAKVDLPESNENNQTSLHLSSIRGHADISEYLINHGAKIDAKDSYGWTPMHFAAAKDSAHCDPTEQFIPPENGKVIQWASNDEHDKIIELLIKHGADIDIRNNDGLSPLYLAFLFDEFDTAALLMEKGANVALTENLTKRNFWHLACIKGHINVVQHLQAFDEIDIGAQDFETMTPLQLAEKHGHLNIVSCILKLLARKLKPRKNEEDNYTPVLARKVASGKHEENNDSPSPPLRRLQTI